MTGWQSTRLRRASRLRWALIVVLAGAVAPLGRALAEDNHVLLELLRDGDSFRVRARAALALGRVADPKAAQALVAALSDQHAAVRAAAATALGEIGDAASVPALKRALRDPTPDVAKRAELALRRIEGRNGHAGAQGARSGAPIHGPPDLRGVRYAVVLGDMRNDSGFASRALQLALSDRVAFELERLQRVVVLTQHELTPELAKALARRKIPSFRIEGYVRGIQPSHRGGEPAVRAEVSLLLLDEPGRNLRSMLKGAATGSGARAASRASRLTALAQKAVRNAVRSALSNAPEAIAAAAAQVNAQEPPRVRAVATEASLREQPSRTGAARH